MIVAVPVAVRPLLPKAVGFRLKTTALAGDTILARIAAALPTTNGKKRAIFIE